MSAAASINTTGIDRDSDLSRFAYEGGAPDTADLSNPLEAYFWSHHEGAVVHKWHHYFKIYHRYFARFRNTPVKMLEIGVSKGGSLEMWRTYFGPDAIIYGIDVDPACAAYDGQAGQVRIGSQDDPGFLAGVVDEMGGVDVVLDDGSHDSHHIRASLQTLYPRLTNGGVYMVEDLHAAYWPALSGGYNAPSSVMNDFKKMIDDMHHWYHSHGEHAGPTNGALAGLHVYDSIVVLEKDTVIRPAHTRMGRDVAAKTRLRFDGVFPFLHRTR